MSISKFILISDSMAGNVVLPQTRIESFSGARAGDERVRRYIRELHVGRHQQGILFIGGNGLKEWKGKPADTPKKVIL